MGVTKRVKVRKQLSNNRGQHSFNALLPRIDPGKPIPAQHGAPATQAPGGIVAVESIPPRPDSARAHCFRLRHSRPWMTGQDGMYLQAAQRHREGGTTHRTAG